MKFDVYRRVRVHDVDGVPTLFEGTEVMIRIKDIKKCEEEVLYFERYSASIAESLKICKEDEQYYIRCTHVYVKAKGELFDFYAPLGIYQFRDRVNGDK